MLTSRLRASLFKVVLIAPHTSSPSLRFCARHWQRATYLPVMLLRRSLNPSLRLKLRITYQCRAITFCQTSLISGTLWGIACSVPTKALLSTIAALRAAMRSSRIARARARAARFAGERLAPPLRPRAFAALLIVRSLISSAIAARSRPLHFRTALKRY